MSVRMRLRRMGTRKKPFYRIVVADQRCSRDGRFIEQVGTYDPRQDPPAVTMDLEKAKKWLDDGVQPSDIVRALLVKQGLLEKKQFAAAAAKPAKAPPKEEPKAEAKAEAAPAKEETEKPAEEPKAEAAPAEQAEAPAPEEAPAETSEEAPAGESE